MARAVRDAKLESPTARAKLKVSYTPHWRAIDPGLHAGYRKGKDGGRWLGRRYLGKAAGQDYESETLPGIADDRQPADGVNVLNFAQAQRAVREWFAKKTAPAPAAGPLTVAQACARYVEYLKAEKRTGHDAEIRLALHVLPAIGDVQVIKLTTEEIEGVKRAMVHKAPDDPDAERRSKDSANRVLTSLKAALNRAFRDDDNHIPSDAAWRRVEPFRKVGGARDVFLDQQQAQRLVNVCQGALRNLVTAALLTGARPPHELAALRARDFHADLGALTIVDGKTGGRTVTLTAEAVKFFAGLAAGKAPDALLLPHDGGGQWNKGLHIRPMQVAVAKAKLSNDATIYCLRHTHASQALLNGMNLKLLAENMGTSVAMIEKHYGKFLAASRQILVEASGFKLGLKTGKVAALGARKAPVVK
jgi:integrase